MNCDGVEMVFLDITIPADEIAGKTDGEIKEIAVNRLGQQNKEMLTKYFLLGAEIVEYALSPAGATLSIVFHDATALTYWLGQLLEPTTVP